MPVAASTSGRINAEFLRLLFLHAHRDANALAGELSEESVQFRFIRAPCLNYSHWVKGSIVLMLGKTSDMRVTIPLDLSTRSFIPLPRFIRTRTTTSLLTPSIVLLNESSVYVVHDVWSFLSFHWLLCVSYLKTWHIFPGLRLFHSASIKIFFGDFKPLNPKP